MHAAAALLYSAVVMRPRHRNLLTLLILPLLLARALIPSGFMLTAGAGGLQLMFCPAGVVQPFSSLMKEHAGQHEGMHHGVDGDDASTSHDDDNAPCPFSLVASATPSAVPFLHASATVVTEQVFEFNSAPAIRVGPIRTDLIRGPPALA
jgi:hypothetical protein